MAGKQTDQAVAQGGITAPKAFDKFKEALASEATLSASFSDEDKALITEQVVESMIKADSLEEAIQAQDAGLISGQQLVDLEQEIQGFDVVTSSKPDAPLGHYLRCSSIALMEFNAGGVMLTPGEEFQWAVGASNVVTLLMKARSLGRLPLEIVLKEKKTEGDKALLLLRLVPKRAQR